MMMRNTPKVALVGLAPGWEAAPFGDPAWEVWSVNDGYRLFGPDRPCTRWFELHGDSSLTRARRAPDHFDRLREMEIPVYYLHGAPPAPKALRLRPDQLALVGRDYFACTVAYMIALALHEGFGEIALYGLPLLANREVVVERPCVTWWLGLAEGRGVTVTVGDHGDLNSRGLLDHPFPYALEDWDERAYTFWEAQSCYQSLADWLPAEAGRLGLRGDSVVRAGPR